MSRTAEGTPSGSRVDAPLAGREVAITGRLASMSRREAVERLTAAGARYAAHPGSATDVLVVGQGGPPLDEDGQPTESLREARRLSAEGRAIEIVQEDELLARLGAAPPDGLRRLYTINQLARILDAPVASIRAWMRQELIRPVKTVRRLAYFEFAQVASAKALCQLTRAGVTPRRIRRSLAELEAWFPSDLSLAQLGVLERGGPLTVRTEEGALVETSGQLRLDFAVPQAPDEAAPEAAAPGEEHDDERDDPAPAPIALSWARARRQLAATAEVATPAELAFGRGVAAEEAGRPEDAVAAYHDALELGGPRPEAHFNLGNVLYALGARPAAARELYAAAALEPDYVEAWNNLGVVLGELDEPEEAMRAFRRALAVEPGYADAHFNLAETLVQAGDLAGAAHHWRAYLREDPTSESADQVRQRLSRIERLAGR